MRHVYFEVAVHQDVAEAGDGAEPVGEVARQHAQRRQVVDGLGVVC